MLLPMINGSTQVYGIIGDPISHSFSPQMHTAAFWDIGFNGVYLPFPISAVDLPQLLPALQLMSVQGFNVTVPYKEQIIPYLDQLSETAQVLGSVNTVIRKNGQWFGHSTDGIGFLRGLEQKGWPVQSQRILVLGAGGSAKAISYALLKAGAAKVDLQNRDQAKAESWSATLRQHFEAVRVGTKKSGSYDLLVNCTSVGLKSAETPMKKEDLAQFPKVIDIIYNPAKTQLLLDAESAGLEWDNGLSMLLFQGVESFELWTQKKAPLEVMRQSLQQQIGAGT